MILKRVVMELEAEKYLKYFIIFCSEFFPAFQTAEE
jgi:hypothetical protein